MEILHWCGRVLRAMGWGRGGVSLLSCYFTRSDGVTDVEDSKGCGETGNHCSTLKMLFLKGSVWQPTQKRSRLVVFQAPIVITTCSWSGYCSLKNIKTIMFFQCCMLFLKKNFTVNYTCMERSAAQPLVAVHVPPNWEEGGRHIESCAAALAITAVDRSGACELACLSGCLSPLGQNISLPLKTSTPWLVPSLSVSLCLSEERFCTSSYLKISSNQHA